MQMPRWYSIVVVFLVLGASVGLSIAYTANKAEESDRRWCALMTELDAAYTATPPTTDVGKRVAASIHNLKTELGC